MQPNLYNIHQVFEQQAATFPNRIALVLKSQQLTYQQLNNRANYLAQHLVELGVQPGDIVAVNLPRSMEQVIAMLGILKAGGAYFPVDDSNPAPRNLKCLESAQVNVLICNANCDPLLRSGRTLVSTEDRQWFEGDLAQFNSANCSDESLAYVMFTSGSTGNPKGVKVPHRAVMRLVIDTNFIDIQPNDNILQFAPASFDASTLEFWGALLNGATLVLYSGSMLDPNLLKQEIATNNVSIMWLTAALFHLVAENFIEVLSPLKVLLAGGDVLNAKHINKVLAAYPQITVVNGYGPTENTTFTCCHVMTCHNPPQGSVLIGQPITGTQIHILDDDLQPVTQGEEGELFTSGKGVALGYLGADGAELPSDAFFYNSNIAEGLIYRTGDLVKQNTQGEVAFVGRKDNQIKLRGYRISLEEIKVQITELPQVRDAIVMRKSFDSGDQLLVAYVLLAQSEQIAEGSNEPEITVNQMKAHLKAVLPNYMIPDHFVLDTDLPINSNGKLDRKALVELT